MNAELQVAIDTAIDAMHTTKVLFDLGDGHILSSALRRLVVAVDAEDTNVSESTLRMVLADLIAAYEREVNPAQDWRDTALTYSEWLDATAEYRAAKAVLDSPYKSEA